MPSDRARSALFDLRDNIALAQSFVGNLSLNVFKADRQAFYATTRALEIISEAARRLPNEVRDRHPQLPWRAIMGVGNVLRHNYEDVAEEQIWRTVTEDLSALDDVVSQEIARIGD